MAHRELSRLEDEVEAAAMEMTIAPLTAIPDVIALLRYIEDFSQENESGFLLWPEIGPAFDGAIERPWAFAILENLRLGLEAVLQEKNTERR